MAPRTPPIKGATPAFGYLRRQFLLALLPLPCACAGLPAGAQDSGASAISSITEITLERDCAGCALGSVLVLRNDGTARLTASGNARTGTAELTSSGVVRRADFDALARLALAQGFFDFDDVYQDPALADGPWATITVVRAGRAKRVFRREDAGPAGLRTLEAAIDAVRARIDFVAQPR